MASSSSRISVAIVLATGPTATNAARSSLPTAAPNCPAHLTDSTWRSRHIPTISAAWKTSSVVISFGSALATSSTSAGPALTASPQPSNTATRTNQNASRSQGRPDMGRTPALTVCTRPQRTDHSASHPHTHGSKVRASAGDYDNNRASVRHHPNATVASQPLRLHS